MADLYGKIDADNNITFFYVTPDFGSPGSNQLLIQDVDRDKSNDYPVMKLINGAYGYKYKWSASTITEKTDAEIKAGLEWKENKKQQLTSKASIDIENLGENEIHSLVGKELLERKNSGPSLTAAEITKVQEFQDARQTILDNVNTNAQTDEFSKASKHSDNTDAPNIEVKTPSIFAVDDEITIIDDGDDPKEEVTTISAIAGDLLTFGTALTNTTRYDQDDTWVYKTG